MRHAWGMGHPPSCPVALEQSVTGGAGTNVHQMETKMKKNGMVRKVGISFLTRSSRGQVRMGRPDWATDNYLAAAWYLAGGIRIVISGSVARGLR